MSAPSSREEIARREVGHTNVTPGVARALVVCFVAMVVALPLVDLAGFRASDEPAPWSRPWAPAVAAAGAPGGEPPAGVFFGTVVPANRAILARLSAFESSLEDQSRIARRLRPPVQTALSDGLGAGNERVYVGREGWLFYRPDVEFVTGRGFLEPGQMARRIAAAGELETPPAPDPRPAIRRFAQDLAARGIALVLVPTPVKPSVHPGFLAARASGLAPLSNASFGDWVASLAADGILVYDPAPSLAAAYATTGTPQYLRLDTHWRPEAAAREAGALAAFLRAHVTLPDAPPAGYTTEPRAARHAGDTALMLDLDPAQTAFPAETVPLRFVVDPSGDAWRPTRGADVLVLGDSFSNIFSLPALGWGEAAGFVEHLSLALDRPVDRLVQNDQGARATRDLLARELVADPTRLATTRVVVWQFATRELAFGDWAIVPLP